MLVKTQLISSSKHSELESVQQSTMAVIQWTFNEVCVCIWLLQDQPTLSVDNKLKMFSYSRGVLSFDWFLISCNRIEYIVLILKFKLLK